MVICLKSEALSICGFSKARVHDPELILCEWPFSISVDFLILGRAGGQIAYIVYAWPNLGL